MHSTTVVILPKDIHIDITEIERISDSALCGLNPLFIQNVHPFKASKHYTWGIYFLQLYIYGVPFARGSYVGISGSLVEGEG